MRVFDLLKLNKNLFPFFIIIISMKLVNRKCHSRMSQPQTGREFQMLGNDSLPQWNSTNPEIKVQILNNYHYAKRETYPSVYSGIKNRLNYVLAQEHIPSAKISTQEVESLNKDRINCSTKDEWKILTLQQIRNCRQSRIAIQKEGQSRKSKNKLYVSISKSSRGSLSNERKNLAQPKLQQIGKNCTLLRSLSNKRQIVDKVQIQLHENNDIITYCCK